MLSFYMKAKEPSTALTVLKVAWFRKTPQLPISSPESPAQVSPVFFHLFLCRTQILTMHLHSPFAARPAFLLRAFMLHENRSSTYPSSEVRWTTPLSPPCVC